MQNSQIANLSKATAVSLVICAIVFSMVAIGTQLTFDNLARTVLCGADQSIIEFNALVEKLKRTGKPSYLQIFGVIWPALLALSLAEVAVINLKIKHSSTGQNTLLKQIGYITLIALIALLTVALAGWLEYCHLAQSTR